MELILNDRHCLTLLLHGGDDDHCDDDNKLHEDNFAPYPPLRTINNNHKYKRETKTLSEGPPPKII